MVTVSGTIKNNIKDVLSYLLNNYILSEVEDSKYLFYNLNTGVVIRLNMETKTIVITTEQLSKCDEKLINSLDTIRISGDEILFNGKTRNYTGTITYLKDKGYLNKLYKIFRDCRGLKFDWAPIKIRIHGIIDVEDWSRLVKLIEEIRSDTHAYILSEEV